MAQAPGYSSNMAANTVLDFGKHKGVSLGQVPAKYLGWLTQWQVGLYCSCGDDECDSDCEQPAKVRRVTKTGCDGETWLGGELQACTCSTCKSIKFVSCRPAIVNAARELVTSRRLCCSCWTPMPPVGSSRSNGKSHADWHGRFLHKTCWSTLMQDA